MRTAGWGALASTIAVAALSGCGGASPLMHPAHVLRPGFVSMGAGVAAQVALQPAPASAPAPQPGERAPASLHEVAIGPHLAPWVGGRIGIQGSNEAGITYSGRSVRLDGRHAFGDSPALSLGLGLHAVVPERSGGDPTKRSVYGGGLDIPLLVGWHSKSDLYAIWAGPRGGFELLGGQVGILEIDPPAGAPDDDPASLEARHVWVGGVAGLRAGFRHVHVVVEVDAAYHHASGTVGGVSASFDQGTIAPAGALVLTF